MYAYIDVELARLLFIFITCTCMFIAYLCTCLYVLALVLNRKLIVS
jgi:hypothetical protein